MLTAEASTSVLASTTEALSLSQATSTGVQVASVAASSAAKGSAIAGLSLFAKIATIVAAVALCAGGVFFCVRYFGGHINDFVSDELLESARMHEPYEASSPQQPPRPPVPPPHHQQVEEETEFDERVSSLLGEWTFEVTSDDENAELFAEMLDEFDDIWTREFTVDFAGHGWGSVITYEVGETDFGFIGGISYNHFQWSIVDNRLLIYLDDFTDNDDYDFIREITIPNDIETASDWNEVFDDEFQKVMAELVSFRRNWRKSN